MQIIFRLLLTVCEGLGRVLPPFSDLSCVEDGKRLLEDLRRSLVSQNLVLADLIQTLLDDFDLFQQSLVAKQIAMIIIGWTRGYSAVKRTIGS